MSSFKNVTNKLYAYKTYIYTKDLALSNPQQLICFKIQPNHPKQINRRFVWKTTSYADVKTHEE